jgi:hypothetical protein
MEDYIRIVSDARRHVIFYNAGLILVTCHIHIPFNVIRSLDFKICQEVYLD